MTAADWFATDDASVYEVRTSAPGPAGSLPLTDHMLRYRPSGDLFGWSQDAAMGWDPQQLGRPEFLILSTQGGVRAPDGSPIALGYHTGHWEIGLLVEAAAKEIRGRGGIPFAGYCSDPCDGRTQGTSGMFDSLPYRNDAAMLLRRLIRSLPTRRGVLGIATCDKGHPAMMMALAAMLAMSKSGICSSDILVDASVRNAMVVHAAFGGSTNLLLHIPAVAHAAGLARPRVQDWIDINRSTPRLVSVLPNGPVDHPTVRVFLAGGVPEVMLHLRELGLIDTSVLTASGQTLGAILDQWSGCERRARFRSVLQEKDGVDPDDVILSPARASAAGLCGTLAFPTGNLAPDGSVVKATSIHPSLMVNGRYRHVGRARVFTSETAAMAAVKHQGERRVVAGDVLVLTGCGPTGTGMEETYQLTAALKQLPWGRQVSLLTDARFSGVSTGACIGHIGPEGLSGGPIGRVHDDDWIEVTIDTHSMSGSIDLIGDAGGQHDAAWGTAILRKRPSRHDLAAADELPDDTRLWAALQQVGGGTWGGCVYDVDAVIERLARNRQGGAGA